MTEKWNQSQRLSVDTWIKNGVFTRWDNTCNKIKYWDILQLYGN